MEARGRRNVKGNGDKIETGERQKGQRSRGVRMCEGIESEREEV